MTTLETEFNKLEESKRTNLANESIRSRDASTHERLADYQHGLTTAQTRAYDAKASRDYAGIGSDIGNSIGSILKGVGSII